MSLVRFTERGDFKPIRRWAPPEAYETWLAMLPPSEYDNIVRAMNAKIDRMDVVRAQYVVRKLSGLRSNDPVYYARRPKFIERILWDVMNTRLDNWAFHKIDKTIVDELTNFSWIRAWPEYPEA